jgi:hypothetical protein
LYSKTDEVLTCSLQRRVVSAYFYKKSAASGNNILQGFSWLMPILMPMFLALIFLSFLPCIIRMAQRFLLDHMSAIANQKFNQLYLQGYQFLHNCPENCCEALIQDTTGA